MERRRGYAVLLLLAVVSTFNGYLGYEEELWVGPDGSGSVHSQIILSPMLARNLKNTEGDSDFAESLTNKFEKIEGLRVTKARTYERSGNSIVAVKMDFDSWERMKGAQLGPDGVMQNFPDFLGVVSLDTDEEGRTVFSRTVGAEKQGDAKTGKEKKEEDALGAGLMEGMFSGYSWKYTVHFPARVVSANTTDEDIDDDNNTVTWNVKLSSVINEPFTMRATLEAPGGYLAPALIGVTLVATIVLVICRMRTRASPRSG